MSNVVQLLPTPITNEGGTRGPCREDGSRYVSHSFSSLSIVSPHSRYVIAVAPTLASIVNITLINSA